MESIIDHEARRLHREGKLTRLNEDAPFETRLALIYEDAPENGLAIIQALEGRAGGGHKGIEMFRVITHPKLLAVVESLVGPEIIGSSVYRIRPKLPRINRGNRGRMSAGRRSADDKPDAALLDREQL
ncbi:MAG: hypothetical protein ACUVR3_03475 [Candidatus Roseilinea sp.]|uniref:hypothetical protein n=1 Tax=Candidatus Roseilinea sp. TaxID=2838777 RepID=UPI004049A64C